MVAKLWQEVEDNRNKACLKFRCLYALSIAGHCLAWGEKSKEQISCERFYLILSSFVKK